MAVARERPVEGGEAPLGLASLSILGRLVVGVGFGATWASVGVQPVLRALETDAPPAVIVALTWLAVVAPTVLYLRRHALRSSVRWNDEAITRVVGERVAVSITWADAWVRRDGTRHALAVQIGDAAGRRITLASGWPIHIPLLSGRHRIDREAFDAIVSAARRGGASFVDGAPIAEPSMPVAPILLVLFLAGIIDGPRATTDQAWALAIAIVCSILLVAPIRRLVATLRRPRALEPLLVDTEERGRLRARRLDGSAVLLDVSTASHPDALLATRRGFVNAVLEVPRGGSGPSYRATETPIPATYVETRDDRVLRFEALRTALVDVIGYGAFFATAVAALTFGA
jgi:hypothetical protein